MSPPPSSSTGSTPVFIAFIVLTFYGLGAGYLESFVNYPLWHIIGGTDRWVAYHEALGPRVVVVLAIPALALSLIANVTAVRPPTAGRGGVDRCGDTVAPADQHGVDVRDSDPDPDGARCRLRPRSPRPSDLVDPVAARYPRRHQSGRRRLHAALGGVGLDARAGRGCKTWIRLD